MSELDHLLHENLVALQRYVHFRIHHKQDAEDILQEVCLSAAENFHTLRNPSAFRAWLVGIARNKCNTYYRKKAGEMNISLDALSESALCTGRLGITEQSIVRDTLEALGDQEKRVLYLYYFRNLSQEDIARRLSIPLGTVKSRLHYAREKFRNHYPCPPKTEREEHMKHLPEFLPEYTIEASSAQPFTVKCEELMGFCLIPRLGEKIAWGDYDMPSRKRNEYTEAAVLGKTEIHGIEGVEIRALQHDDRTGTETERMFAAQLTDTHCRYLAESHWENGVRKCFTFLDGEIFMNNWGFGEDNCGFETCIRPRGVIHRQGRAITTTDDGELVDVTGRYTVTIGGKAYDTICVMDIGHFHHRIAIEQYLDQNGRTVLWRRFNRNDWAKNRYGRLWTELLPDNERLTINGEVFVHWYDCITDYIL